jgi:hypothetical protein
MDEALRVAVILPPPWPIPVEVHANVVPGRAWSDVGNLNATIAPW